MRVALYARVSTSDQKCDMQLSDLRQYAAARQWDVVAEFVDEGFSGKNSKRPALQKCLAMARARRADAIAVWKMDRWGRTLYQLVNDVHELKDLGVRFVSVTQGIDTGADNPMATAMMHMLGVFAEMEREMIVERVRSGVRNAQKHGTRSGKAIGRPKAIFDRQKVRDMRATGASLRNIALATGQALTTVVRVLGEKA